MQNLDHEVDELKKRVNDLEGYVARLMAYVLAKHPPGSAPHASEELDISGTAHEETLEGKLKDLRSRYREGNGDQV